MSKKTIRKTEFNEKLYLKIILVILILILLISLFFTFKTKEDDDLNFKEYGDLNYNDCKSFNTPVTLSRDTAVCSALPWLFINKVTKDCLYRGCGYSPYTSPGEDWIRIQ